MGRHIEKAGMEDAVRPIEESLRCNEIESMKRRDGSGGRKE